MLAPLLTSLLLAGLAPACADDPIPRSVERSVVTSPRQPAAAVHVGRDFVDIGGYRFRQNTFAFSGAPDSAPPGEAALTAQFLAARGYDAPDLWLASRFVALGSPDRRSEFIVFYLEPAAGGLKLGDLYHGEDETPAWHALRKTLADRSRQAFAMSAPAAASAVSAAEVPVAAATAAANAQAREAASATFKSPAARRCSGRNHRPAVEAPAARPRHVAW